MSYRGKNGYIGEYKGQSVYGVSLIRYREMIESKDPRIQGDWYYYINDCNDYIIDKNYVIGTLTDHVERCEAPLHVSKYTVFQPREEKREYPLWKEVQTFTAETKKTEEVKVTTPKEVGIDTGAVAVKTPVSEPIPQIDSNFDFSIYTKIVDDFFQKLKEKEEA